MGIGHRKEPLDRMVILPGMRVDGRAAYSAAFTICQSSPKRARYFRSVASTVGPRFVSLCSRGRRAVILFASTLHERRFAATPARYLLTLASAPTTCVGDSTTDDGVA